MLSRRRGAVRTPETSSSSSSVLTFSHVLRPYSDFAYFISAHVLPSAWYAYRGYETLLYFLTIVSSIGMSTRVRFMILARAKRERVVQDGVEKANRRPTRPTRHPSLLIWNLTIFCENL